MSKAHTPSSYSDWFINGSLPLLRNHFLIHHYPTHPSIVQELLITDALASLFLLLLLAIPIKAGTIKFASTVTLTAKFPGICAVIATVTSRRLNDLTSSFTKERLFFHLKAGLQQPQRE